MSRPSSSTGGPSKLRQLRVGEVIRRALSEILARGEAHDAELAHASITVSEVRMSTDLRHATAFVLPLGGVNTPVVVKALNRNRNELRRLVTSRIDLRYSPELSFQPDESFDRMDRTRELLRSPEVSRDLADDLTEEDPSQAPSRD
jgi:ribosome-binding factor A